MFRNPVALVALSLLALPVLIHMLARLKGPRVLFPTIKYLRATESHRLTLRKIERWPLLVIRLFACGLLVFAISDPVLIGKAGRKRAVLLLVDSSLSMNTESIKEQARARSREVAASLQAGDIAAVAQFDSSVDLLCDFTEDRDRLETGIASFSPHYGTADFSSALVWANEKLAAVPYTKELILISDLQAVNVYSSAPVQMRRVDMRIIRVGGERRVNRSISSVAARATGDTLEIESTALLAEGDRLSVTPVSFKIARSEREVSSVASDSNAILSASMIEGDIVAGAITTNKPDEFDADDTRFFVAHLRGEEKILLVESRIAEPGYTTFIEKAIRASSQSETAAKHVEIGGAIPERSDALRRYSVVVAPVDALTGSGVAAAREYVRNGGSLIVTFGSDTRYAADRLDDLSGTKLQVSFDRIAETESLGLMPPVMANDKSDDSSSIDAREFASARFSAAHSIHAGEGEPLLRYSNTQIAVARIRLGAGQVLVPGFGLSDSSLSRSPAFPVIIDWLISRGSAEKRAMQFDIGQAPAALLLPGLSRLTRLYSINGPRQEELDITLGALTEPGVYEARYQSEKRIFALNQPSAESTPGQATDSELLGRVEIEKDPAEAGSDVTPANGTDLWRGLAIVALVMSLLEMAYKRVWPIRE